MYWSIDGKEPIAISTYGAGGAAFLASRINARRCLEILWHRTNRCFVDQEVVPFNESCTLHIEGELPKGTELIHESSLREVDAQHAPHTELWELSMYENDFADVMRYLLQTAVRWAQRGSSRRGAFNTKFRELIGSNDVGSMYQALWNTLFDDDPLPNIIIQT